MTACGLQASGREKTERSYRCSGDWVQGLSSQTSVLTPGLGWHNHRVVTRCRVLYLPFGASAPPGLNRVTGLSRRSTAAVKPKTNKGVREGRRRSPSQCPLPLLAGWPCSQTHTTALPHPDWAFSPLMSIVTWGRQPAGSLQPLGWAGCSIACLLAQRSFLSACWPAASARQQEGTGWSRSTASPARGQEQMQEGRGWQLVLITPSLVSQSPSAEGWAHKAPHPLESTALLTLTFAWHGVSSGAFRFSPTFTGEGFAASLLPAGESSG